MQQRERSEIRYCIIALISFALFFAIINSDIIYNENREFEENQTSEYDLIVYSAEPEGIIAAVSGRRAGLKVLLVDEREAIGGLMVLGKLNFIDMNYDRTGMLLTKGLFEKFYEKVGGNAFELKKADEVFKTMLLDEGVDVLLGVKVKSIGLEADRINRIVVEREGTTEKIKANFFVDASVDGDLAYEAGVPYTAFGEDQRKPERLMGVTLVFELENVDWGKVFTYLNTNRLLGKYYEDDRQFAGAKFKTAWGYADEGYAYRSKDGNLKLRGLNIARQNNGNVLINGLIIFGVNPLEAESLDRGFERAKNELEHIVPYLNQNYFGFENARLVGIAEEMYTRESRHFKALYTLDIDDVLENRSFEDQITIGSYPVDIQPTDVEDYGSVIGKPDKYGIPFRSLVPEKVTNLLLVGKKAGYSSMAAGSARVLPIGMCEGEAAGMSAEIALINEVDFHEFAKRGDLIEKLREEIKNHGGLVDYFESKEDITLEKEYEEIKKLRRIGLLAGGYHNNYYLDEIIDKWKYEFILNGILEYNGISKRVAINDQPTWHDIIDTILKIENIHFNSYNDKVNHMRELGITKKFVGSYEESVTQPTTREIIVFLSDYNDYLK